MEENVKLVWDSEDFEHISWVGSRIHAITLPNENSELVLDIDFIYETECNQQYSIVVCKLIFYSIKELVIKLDYQDQQPLVIHQLTRCVIEGIKPTKYYAYCIETSKGNISFQADDMRQHAKAPIYYVETPYIAANKRRETPIDFNLHQVSRGLMMDLLPQLENDEISTQAKISIDEDAFAFIEPSIANVIPDYADFGHWRDTQIEKDDWLKIIKDLKLVIINLSNAKQPTDCTFLRFLFGDIRIDFIRDFNRMRVLIINMIEQVIVWLEEKLAICQQITVLGV